MKRIDVLPDDVLLEIFDFHDMIMNQSYEDKTGIEAWQSLVHVCRRWRSLVFRSPLRLNLRLFCTPNTPARDTLDVWPALPLIVTGDISVAFSSGTDNVIAALGQSNRVCHVDLWSRGGRRLKNVLAAMQVPFPELTDLRLHSNFETPPFIPVPDSFLGGSAPRLQSVDLFRIPFSGLPKLLLSATHLVDLQLSKIPHSAYISPEAMVAPLSALTSLETFSLGFQSPQSCPDWGSRSLPPLKRSILPVLKRLNFEGVTEYLEELVTRIDAPQLDELEITFFNQIDFDTPRLAQFINCTPTLRVRDGAHVSFDYSTAYVELLYQTSESDFTQPLISISCRCGELDWQLSFIEQVCNSSLPPIPMVEDLYIRHLSPSLVWKNDAIENTLWLQFLLPFTAVKNLYVSKEFAPGIAAALEELVGARIIEVLPGLQNIFVEGLEPSGPFHENIGQFVATRQLSNHPIAISDWDKEDENSDMESM
jgi:F-box-like